MTYFFIGGAIFTFVGFGIHAARRNGHGMIYAGIVCVAWILAALWWSGAIGVAKAATTKMSLQVVAPLALLRPLGRPQAPSGGQPPEGGETAVRT